MACSPSRNRTGSSDGPWQDLVHPQKLEKMFQLGFMVDCKFIVGPDTKTAEIIDGHKLMFAMESPVFESMMCGDFVEAKNALEIRLAYDDPTAFKHLRLMLYNTDRILKMKTFPLRDIINLYRLCDKYLITSLTKLCINHIRNSYIYYSSESELLLMFSFINEFKISCFRDQIKSRLKQRGYPLTITLNEFNQTNFTDYICLASTSDRCSRSALFNTIETYLTYHQLTPDSLLDVEVNEDITDSVEETQLQLFLNDSLPPTTKVQTEYNKHELLKSLLACVDFGKMSTEEFLKGPAKSKILTLEQKFSILSQLSEKPCCKCSDWKVLSIKLY